MVQTLLLVNVIGGAIKVEINLRIKPELMRFCFNSASVYRSH
jgi:hypothetical protein